MATRNELVAAVAERYARSSRSERGRILDEFVAVTGHHRKHAMRLLRGGDGPAERQRRRGRVYDAAMRETLIVLWEASDRVCGKRLRPLLPVLVEAALPRKGRLPTKGAVCPKSRGTGTQPVGPRVVLRLEIESQVGSFNYG